MVGGFLWCGLLQFKVGELMNVLDRDSDKIVIMIFPSLIIYGGKYQTTHIALLVIEITSHS